MNGAARVPMYHATRRSVDAYPDFQSLTQTHRLSAGGCLVDCLTFSRLRWVSSLLGRERMLEYQTQFSQSPQPPLNPSPS